MWYATIECNWHTSNIQHGLRCVEFYEKCQLRSISPLQLLLQLQGAEPAAKGLRTAAKTGQARTDGRQESCRTTAEAPKGQGKAYARQNTGQPPKERRRPRLCDQNFAQLQGGESQLAYPRRFSPSSDARRFCSKVIILYNYNI